MEASCTQILQWLMSWAINNCVDINFQYNFQKDGSGFSLYGVSEVRWLSCHLRGLESELTASLVMNYKKHFDGKMHFSQKLNG